MTCPYPPSDPACSSVPTTTTTIMHVVVVNQDVGSAGGIEYSVNSVQRAVEHQEHVMVIGFTALVVTIAIVGALIAATIHNYWGKHQ